MEEIKVADTSRYVSFYAYDSADHISPADGITSFTVYYFLNNGSATAIVSETVTEKDSTNMKGWYTLAVDVGAMVSAEGVLSINIEASGMDPVAIKVKIVGNTTKEVYDVVAHADYGNSKLVRSTTPANSLDVLATGEADANVTQWLGTAAATPTVAGVPEVDVTHWLGTSVTASVAGQPTVDVHRIDASSLSLASLKDFADTGYDDVTHKVQGVVLVDTTTTNTDMVGTDNAALAATALTDVTWTDAKAAFIDHAISTVDTNLDTLLTRITAARAGYLDNLSVGAVALAATALTDVTWTDAKAAFLDHSIVTVDTNVDTLLTRITAARAGYLDNLSAGAVALASALATAQTDLDTITGTDGVTLATAQALYAPNKVVPDAAGTAATLHGTTDGKVDAVQTDSTAIKAKTDNLPSGIAKNVALSDFEVYMILSSDHATAATGKTLTGTISKDGGAFASLTNAITEISGGMYKVDLTQAEMNANVITLLFTEINCDDQPYTVYTT